MSASHSGGSLTRESIVTRSALAVDELIHHRFVFEVETCSNEWQRADSDMKSGGLMLRTLQYVEDVDGVLNLGLSHTSAMRCCECVFLATEILEHGYVTCTVGQ